MVSAAQLVDAWDASYKRHENTLFYPSEGVVAFVNKNIRRRIGAAKFSREFESPPYVLDLGSGAGRHLRFLCENGLYPIGVELSSEACLQARAVLDDAGFSGYEIHNCDGGQIPIGDSSVEYAISVATFDSMRRVDAERCASEVRRVLKKGGLFYADLISDTCRRSGMELSDGEYLIDEAHEQGTVQLFFNPTSIREIFGAFKLNSLRLTQVLDESGQTLSARWACVFENA